MMSNFRGYAGIFACYKKAAQRSFLFILCIARDKEKGTWRGFGCVVNSHDNARAGGDSGIFERKEVVAMTLGDLLRLLCDNYVLLRIQQRLIEARLKRLEDEVKALQQQGPRD